MAQGEFCASFYLGFFFTSVLVKVKNTASLVENQRNRTKTKAN